MKTTEQRRPNRWFRDFWRLAKPFWTSEKWPKAVLLLIGSLSSVLGSIYFGVVVIRNNGAFVNSIANRSQPEFIDALTTYAWLGVFWIVFGGMGHYFLQRLKLLWREWMTRRFLELWFQGQRHYFWNLTQHNGTDNPDQRISEDIKIFINTTQVLTVDLLQNILTVITYGSILWSLSGIISFSLGPSLSISIHGYLFWLCVGYSMLSNFSVYIVGKRLIPLEYEQQHHEADFRATLLKMRENTEVIALALGEKAEVDTAMNGFDLIVKNFRAIIRKTVHLEIFNQIRERARKICVALAAAPRVFSGAMTVGAFTQALEAFTYLEQCVGFLADQFQTFADWRSAARRLSDFEESLTRAGFVEGEMQNRPVLKSKEGVATIDLEIQTPDARQLIDQICLEIREGERVLLKGKSGSGKSTLFRVLAGLWPFFSGRIKKPERTKSTFLSQTPYIPPGTLRQVILYPTPEASVSSEDIISKLNLLGLTHLSEKLDVKEDWQKVLSPGEQQRLVLIRAIFQNPKWLFLDEATSALDSSAESKAYEMILSHLPNTGVVSIGHRKELEKFHGRVIDLNPEEQPNARRRRVV
jgi:vitamin B12/bleomycin/antimicrobial peptide transport system ATP-binding/permease protein